MTRSMTAAVPAMMASEKGEDQLRPAGFQEERASLLLSTFAINILSLALPVMTLQVYDRILPNPGSGTLPILIVGVVVALLLEGCLRIARAYSLGWSGAAYEHRLSCITINHILNADLSQMGRYGIGEHLHKIGAIAKIKDFYNGYALITVAELIFVPIFFGLILYIAGPLAIVPTMILMGFTIFSLWDGQKLRKALRDRDITDDYRYNFLIETLDGIHSVKAFGAENRFQRRYEALEERSTEANMAVTQRTASLFNMGNTVSHIMVAAIITVGAVFVLYGQLTTGALIATLLLSGRMMQPIQRALALWARYQEYVLGREKIESILATPLHVPTNLARQTDQTQLREGILTMENVSFRFQENESWVLRDVNLSVGKGEAVHITGTHGAGKTVLLNLIAGIYPITKGEILIDGENVLTYPSEKLVRHVGYIRTDSLIFRGSIRDNITCFGLHAEQDVREIAHLLKVDRDVARLPSGFDTVLTGDGTDSIPPGLKQRITMVRVLAAKPRLILFDNADRSLDREGYSLIHSLFARLKGKATLIMVSDDQNMQALADRAVHLENGSLTPLASPTDSNRLTPKPYQEFRL